MDWSNEKILDFLDVYQTEPIIWDAAHPLHKNRNEVYDAWKRVQQKLSTDVPIPDLKKKKESLMAAFRGHLKKVHESIKSGCGTDEVYKPIWFAYEKMASFLKTKDLPRETLNSMDIESQLEMGEITLVEAVLNVQNEAIVNIENPDVLLSTESEIPPPPRKKKKMNEDTKMQMRMDEAYSILKSSVEAKNRRDECEIFGELVASKLRKMDDSSRDVAMNRIENMLFEMRMHHNKLHQVDKKVQYVVLPQPQQTRSRSASPLLPVIFSKQPSLKQAEFRDMPSCSSSPSPTIPPNIDELEN